MEYIWVEFDPEDVRDVLANDDKLGRTERRLTIDTGHYEIRLDGVATRPAKRILDIVGTTPDDPMRIRFRRR
jgi:hypothetical protein